MKPQIEPTTTPIIIGESCTLADYDGRTVMIPEGHETGVLIVRNIETGALVATPYSPHYTNGWYRNDIAIFEEIAMVEFRGPLPVEAFDSFEFVPEKALEGYEEYAFQSQLEHHLQGWMIEDCDIEYDDMPTVYL